MSRGTYGKLPQPMRARLASLTRAALACAWFAALASGCAGEKAEGRPWVHKVQLEGVHRVDAKDLKKKIAVEPTSWVPLSRKKYLDPFTLDADRARIEAYYRAHGWFEARVTAADATPYHGSGVDVRFVVDEGLPTHITRVDLRGLDAVGPKGTRMEKHARAKLKVGDVFDHQRYLDVKAHIEDQLKKLGYAWATVDGRVEIDRDARTAQVTLAADPQAVCKLGYVHVQGTEKVDPRLLAIHTGLRRGDRFDPDDLEAARGKIYNLGLFSSVKVEITRVADAPPDVVDVMVLVKESTFRELRIGGGIGFESLRNDAHLAVRYTRRNWLGRLRTLQLRLEPAYVAIPAVWNIQRQGPGLISDAVLTQPDVPFPLATLKFTLGFDIGIDYAYQYYGPRAQLGVNRNFWREHVQLSIAYNFQLLKFFNTDPAIFFDPAASGVLFGYTDPYRLGYFEESVALDLRDRPLDAHSGAYIATTAEQGGNFAGGAFQYEKLLPEVRAYLPLGRRVTLAGRAQFGQLFVQGDLGSPSTRRFYLGGPNSHRGFNYNRLSLQVPSGIPGVEPLPIGGDQMVLLQGELRVDVAQLFGQWLAVAGFFDAGDVAAPSCGADPTGACRALFGRVPTSVQWGNLHLAVGGGLRYRTLIGTVRVDLGVRLNRLSQREPDGTPNPDPGQRFAFHISVGESF
jgi:translocation and assembly module TamA